MFVIYNNYVVNNVFFCILVLGKSSRVKYVVKEDLRIIVINFLVLSKLYYCFSVWFNIIDRNITKL